MKRRDRHPFAVELGAELQRLMDDQGVSQTALAAEVGSTQATISRHLRGENDMGTLLLARVCTVLGVSPGEIWATVTDRVNSRYRHVAA
jgi:transcriptional regulator with XRE-family HTH domain